MNEKLNKVSKENNFVCDKIIIDDDERELINSSDNGEQEINLEMQKIKGDTEGKNKNENEKWEKVMGLYNNNNKFKNGEKINMFKLKKNFIPTPYQKMIKLNEKIRAYKTNYLFELNKPISLGYIKNCKAYFDNNILKDISNQKENILKTIQISSPLNKNKKKQNCNKSYNNTDCSSQVNFWQTKIIPSYLVSETKKGNKLPYINNFSNKKENIKNFDFDKKTFDFNYSNKKFDYSLDKIDLNKYSLLEFNLNHLIKSNYKNKYIFNTRQLISKSNKLKDKKFNDNFKSLYNDGNNNKKTKCNLKISINSIFHSNKQ